MYKIKSEITLPISIEKAWSFFSNPMNLPEITPKNLAFQILNQEEWHSIWKKVGFHPGMIIEYKIRPMLGIPIYWATEITQVIEKKMFIDEQRFGPYKFWHHKHYFEKTTTGTLVHDLVHYKLPFEPISKLGAYFIKRQLKEIFAYRKKTLEQKFPQ